MTETTVVAGSGACPIAFDHHSPEHARNWNEDFRAMREQCPHTRSDKYGGFWVASRYNDVLSIAQSAENFTSEKTFDPLTGKAEGGLAIPPFPSPPAKPSETQSPEWDGLRAFLNSRFAPKSVERHRVEARRLAAALVDRFIETGRFDIVDDLTNPLPALVTMRFFGFPLDDWAVFAEAIHKLVYIPQTDPEFMKAIQGVEHFRDRVQEEVEIRRRSPRDDLLGYFAAGTIDGQPLDMELIKNMSFNILAGGVDTTTALTSNTLLYLSRNPRQRRRLIEEPKLLPLACEEFVRYFTPLHTLARTAKHDVTLGDWTFAKGDRVLLAYASANRDPDIFDEPEDVKLDRAPNRHIGFGAGMHRCLGSFVARIMFQAMMTEVLTRLPDYQVVENQALPYPSIGAVNGWIHMPATFTPGAKVGETIAGL